MPKDSSTHNSLPSNGYLDKEQLRRVSISLRRGPTKFAANKDDVIGELASRDRSRMGRKNDRFVTKRVFSQELSSTDQGYVSKSNMAAGQSRKTRVINSQILPGNFITNLTS